MSIARLVLKTRNLCEASSSTFAKLNLLSSKASETVMNPNLIRGEDQRDLTNMDLLEEKIRNAKKVREITIDGQTQKWAYRSEIVGKLGLDKNHTNTWISYFFIIIFGFTAFIIVKSQVVMGRKDEMEAREQLRRELKLSGADRKKIAIVE